MKKGVLSILCCIVPLVFATERAHFEYSQSGQSSWMKEYPQCAGSAQSPIVISASRSVELPLPALEMIGYHDFLALPLKLKNNGYTVSLKIKQESSSMQSPYIFGALLNPNDKYELDSLHFHWGLKNSRGSEHVLHGTRYPMEMHLVHRNAKYENLEKAVQNADGLAVVAVFFHLEEEENEQLKPLIAHLPEIQWMNTETQLNQSIILSSILPGHLDTYYTYRGSLTTPPCYEVVTWIVFADSIPISFKQMHRFRLLSNGKGILADNYRHLQDLHNRKVYVRRTHSVFINKNEVYNLDVSSLNWYWQR